MGIAIAICDDERAQRDYLKRLAEGWAASRGESVTVTLFPSAESFMFDNERGLAPGILLLDIQMGGVSGLELAKRIRARGDAAQIVFVTAYADFMAEGYDVSALHYLMKPVEEEKLFAVLDKAAARLSAAPRVILLPGKGGGVRIKADDILYAEVLSHAVTLRLKAGEETLAMRMADMEALLGEGFFRCHRSYIVSMKYVRRVTRAAMLLDDGTQIPLSRHLYDAANQAFIHYNT